MTSETIIYWLTLAAMLATIGVILFAWCVVHQVRSVHDYARKSKQIWASLEVGGQKMTQMREKVAKAIATVLYSDGHTSDDRTSGTDWQCADAALTACGYAEMQAKIERLQDLLESTVTSKQIWRELGKSGK